MIIDNQQFHQYQQNEQSPLIEHNKAPRHRVRDRYHNVVAGLNWLMGSKPNLDKQTMKTSTDSLQLYVFCSEINNTTVLHARFGLMVFNATFNNI